jgi:hypothetical protein
MADRRAASRQVPARRDLPGGESTAAALRRAEQERDEERRIRVILENENYELHDGLEESCDRENELIHELNAVKDERDLARTDKSRVGQYAKQTGTEHSRIHAALNRHFDERSIDQATLETLKGRLSILDRWISEA